MWERSGEGPVAKQLRRNSSNSEKLLWKHLKVKQLDGLKFRRQEPVGSYIVDFVCFEKALVVELDGGQHAVNKEKDEAREEWLREQGFKVLRFWNNDLINIEQILEIIRVQCNSDSGRNMNHPLPASPIEGEE